MLPEIEINDDCYLRPIEKKDWRGFYELCRNREDIYWLPRRYHCDSEKNASHIITHYAHMNQRVDHNIYYYAIDLFGEMNGFMEFKIKDKTVAMTYILNPRYKNQGWMTFIISKLLSIYEKDYDRIIADVALENLSSVRVLEKIGFILESTRIIKHNGKNTKIGMFVYEIG